MADMAEYPTPEDRITALLAYVGGTRDVEADSPAARVRLSAADEALALAKDTGATADVVTACVQALKDASTTYYAAGRQSCGRGRCLRRSCKDRSPPRDKLAAELSGDDSAGLHGHRREPDHIA